MTPADDDLIVALRPVVDALRKLGVRHYVGGSVASSFHGASRSTMDVDLVCELTVADVVEFTEFIGTSFYASEAAIRDAIRRQSCFNLIHLPTSFKVDLFISRGRPFDLDAMERATTQQLGEAVSVEVPVAAIEDSIISKLEWFRLSNETSERQWNDVTRLVDLAGDTLDSEYLIQAATSVGVADLLARLMTK